MQTGNCSDSTAASMWFLIGQADPAGSVQHIPIHSIPFQIGRRLNLPLSLPCPTVSGDHAELFEQNGRLMVRDLESTNGTFVNGSQVRTAVFLQDGDIVQFADIAFRLCHKVSRYDTQTIGGGLCDAAIGLIQLDKLLSERAVVPYFQPVVDMQSQEIVAYEALARSRLFGLQTPGEMFSAACQLELERELSRLLREEAVAQAVYLPGSPNLLVNTSPREITDPYLLVSLEATRTLSPSQALTLEVHEAAITDSVRMRELRVALNELDIGLAYDDFGAGQSRLIELTEVPPDYVKFDTQLIRGIHLASERRQRMLAHLVHMTNQMGVVAVAEGIECEQESELCRQLGFGLAQGFYFGKPAPASRRGHGMPEAHPGDPGS